MTSAKLPEIMRAARIHEPGGIDGLTVDEIAVPSPRAGEVLVKVHAAAITRDELNWPVGRLPAIPSYELSGTVELTGSEETGLQSGQAVYGMTGFDRDGVAAEYAIALSGELSPKPKSVSHALAAAVPLPALSAFQGLFDHGDLVAGERVLIHGGGGGVGSYAVQLALRCGAHVIATAAGERVGLAAELGAHEVIDHTVVDFTGIDPVDLVFDTAGGERLVRSVEVLRSAGRLVSVAEDPPTEECRRRGIDATWYLVESNPDQLAELTELVDQGAVRVPPVREFSLSDARSAFELVMAPKGYGKVVFALIEEPDGT